MSKLLRKIEYPCKIEVGSGGAPQAGYVHVDIDQNMPSVDALCKMGEEDLPFPDGSVSEILSNHSIEHILWPKLSFAIKDWWRVLVPGGRIFLRTPDLEYICQSYVTRKTTREHPVDMSAMISTFCDWGPAECANVKLFAGQNYPGNIHYFCLDFDMATRLLTSHGFINISRLNILPVFSPGELQIEAFKSQ
jgi:predicted SAM-dependent methyltransferase